LPDYQSLQLGGVVNPLTASTSNTLLKDADPAVYYLLDFFAGVIAINQGERWNAVIAAAGFPSLINTTVAHKVPYDPFPYGLEDHLSFPLLAFYRTSQTFNDKTLQRFESQSTFDLLYLMPPMRSDQVEQLYPFLANVARIITSRARLGFDPQYLSGARIFATAGLSQHSVENAVYGAVPNLDTGLTYPSVRMTLTGTELFAPVASDFDPFEGQDTDVQQEDEITDVAVSQDFTP
jgi:hypothetical protein